GGAEERCAPALREQALVIVTTATMPARHPSGRKRTAPRTSISRVVEAGPLAREAGVRPGMTETEAHARCPALVTRALCVEHVNAAHQPVLDAALAVSPRVGDAGAGIVHVDIAGLASLVGDEHAVAERLLRQTSAVGLHSRVGVAGTRTAARIAARMGPRTVVIPL